jgi:hypothetical protein
MMAGMMVWNGLLPGASAFASDLSKVNPPPRLCTPGPSKTTLFRFHKFATNQTITLGTIEKPISIYLDVSPDGRWLLYSREDQQVENLMLVENFH